MNLDSSNLGMAHPWQEGEPKINKFCFIGKNLDKTMIKELKECLFDGKIQNLVLFQIVILNIS